MLLATLVVLLVVATFVGRHGPQSFPRLPQLVTAALFVAVVIAAVATVSESRRRIAVAGCLAAPLVAAWLANVALDVRWLDFAQPILGILFVGYAVVVIVLHLFRPQRVTANMIAASICAYLLLAIVWSEAYELIELAKPGSFDIAHVEDLQGQPFSSSNLAFALYYSFVTLTTLGYGDVTPVTAPARTFAALEAVTGQLYIAVLVSRLVGLHIVHSSAGPDNRAAEPPDDRGV